MNTHTHIAAFYHFTDFADFQDWREPLKQLMKSHGVGGTVLLAPEGINATIAGSPEGIEAVVSHIRSDERFANLFVKPSLADHMPFSRARVRLKKETITLGLPANVPERTGKILSPEEWNHLLNDPELVLLDTRNTYETKVGTFENAIVWPLNDFQELPEKILQSFDKKKKIAMFCTGGIRCEKLSSWMMGEGYDEIYQLEGGILHYLDTVPKTESKWQGECYVFDSRIAVGHACTPSTENTMCPACGDTLTPADRTHPAWLPAIQCGGCAA
jgi:UPF0176 protein